LKSFSMVILLVLCTSLAFTLWLEEGIAQPQAPPPPSRSALVFKQISLEVRVVNATYAEFKVSASIMNTSNQTFPYVIVVSPSIGYMPYYPFAPPFAPAEPHADFGIEATSERLGQLNVTVDKWTARASSSLEAGGEDRIRLDGWMALRQTRHLIWREYVEDSVSFSFGPPAEYVGPGLPSGTDLKVMFMYPTEYTRIDETNYQVEIKDGYKLVRYSERFYGDYGILFNLYKPRIPVSSLTVFSTLWVLLIAVVLAIRRKHVKD